jgi:cytochrome bd ubiquinol oxidase subunit I
MDLDPLLLSRIQFAFVVSFHILFPAFTIGLASWLAMLEFLWLRTGRDAFQRLYRFWLKLFAVSFAMGVVSGITMSYQFGTNWSRFSDAAGPVVGPLMGYEVLTAFFLEASFLGIMLFGWKRVGRGFHFFSTLMVAFGTLLSAFWILSANSWMHTPAGFEIRDGIFHPMDWWAIVFNPSFPYRFTHMVLAAYLTTCFAVAGVSAWRLLRGRAPEESRIGLAMAMGFAAIVVPLQILAGDLHGLNTLEHQPAKIAAMEGHWETRAGAPFILFAVPDPAAERNRHEIAIPKLGSLILTHDWDGVVRGLKEWPRENRPPVWVPFYAFRVMVGIGLCMLAVGLCGVYLLGRGRLYDSRRFLRVCVLMGPSGFLAVLCGWFTTEVGRQPFVVYGLMRTADAASPVPGANVALSLAAFIAAYTIIFGAGLFYMARLVGGGDARPEPPPSREAQQPKRPLSLPE